MRQSWPRISIANRMWGGLRAFSGPCSIFTALLLVLVSKLFCSQPFPPSEWVLVRVSVWKFSTGVLSVMVPGGCCSHGCHCYLHTCLWLPQVTQTPSPHPKSNGFKLKIGMGKQNWLQILHVGYHILLYRHACFTGKYTTCKIHKNYIWDPSGLFSIILHVSLLMT